MSKVLIVGGGAAGMMAAVHAAEKGHEVHLYDKNEKLGKKLYITGKGRCNVTNNCETEELFRAVMSNPKFLYSAFYTWNSQDVMEFFEQSGVSLKTERGNRVFPVSDHSSDIIRALERRMRDGGVQVHLRTRILDLITEELEDSGEKNAPKRRVTGIILGDGEQVTGDAVILATGGMSYQTTGSTGDGYRMAEECGHRIVSPEPSLVPLVTKEEYIPRLQGLSLKNVTLTIKRGKKTLYQDFGEMMFTHFGITGPLVLSASAVIGKELSKGELSGYLDLKPALTMEQLDARILREFGDAPNKQFKNVIGVLFPSSLTPVMLELGGIQGDKKIHEITREERIHFEELVKAFPFTITGKGEFKEAIITKGGVNVKQVQPGTMESKLVKDLYIIGEVLDLDAVTGGFNLQIAWSTAYLCAMSLGEN
ncbi:MAG: NAD(P)/FAD-dependent oxidoreductase [Eubacteriales bacterium]|nr:NAD(P)/FAD-dependent oxidoreductase [Eubacteriales bacterium]